MSDDRLFEPINQPASVRIIADDFLPGIAPRHHVINAALKFSLKSSWALPAAQERSTPDSIAPRAPRRGD
jgi:hypothetical protein